MFFRLGLGLVSDWFWLDPCCELLTRFSLRNDLSSNFFIADCFNNLWDGGCCSFNLVFGRIAFGQRDFFHSFNNIWNSVDDFVSYRFDIWMLIHNFADLVFSQSSYRCSNIWNQISDGLWLFFLSIIFLQIFSLWLFLSNR